MPTPLSHRTLRALREAKGWSHDDLARESGVNRRSLIRYENPEYQATPSTTQVERLAKAFGVDPKDLSSEPSEVVVAEGPFVPIRIEVFRIHEDSNQIRHVQNPPDEIGADCRYVTMMGQTPDTLIVQAASERKREKSGKD